DDFTAIGTSLPEKVSSLTPGHVRRGACWNYHALKSIKADQTHISTVFEARVVPHNARVVPDRHLVTNATKNMQREVLTCQPSDVASAKRFRGKMYDIIYDTTIALEWLDTSITEVKYHPDIQTYTLVNSLSRAALSGFLILENHEHTGKPANMLIGIRTDRAIAKVADLGLVCYARPEVFLGNACTGPSQVWTIGAMLLCWIKSRLKSQRLIFPRWEIPPPEMAQSDILKDAVRSARSFCKEVPDY
ncbi:hypothetical protein N7535_002394, partial [Penicillium sp. DV-2018c]